MKKENYSAGAGQTMRRAFGYAADCGQGFAGSEHILWALAGDDGPAGQVLDIGGVDQALIAEMVEKYALAERARGDMPPMGLAPEAERVMIMTEAQAEKLHHKIVEPEHLLMAILQEGGCTAAKLLQAAGADTEQMLSALLRDMGVTWPRAETDRAGAAGEKKAETKTVEEYSTDLTAEAVAGKLDPVIGREKEIERVVQILSRRQKNNPVLIGEPGVGKTAIAEGLAQRIVAGNVPENLYGKRVMSLDLGRMLSGTRFRGDFEERMDSLLTELKGNHGIILFIDELHHLMGAGGGESSLDAAGVFKPALSRGEVQVIGATTLNEYRKHIEKDSALERRFQPVKVGEPGAEDAVKILRGLRSRYEAFHGLSITDEAIAAAVELSRRYIADRYLPDKAIDLIDEAAARLRSNRLSTPAHLGELEERIQTLAAEKQQAVQKQDFEKAATLRDQQAELKRVLEMHRESWNEKQSATVDAEAVAEVVSAWTGVPVTMLTRDESERLMALEESLHRRVVGQNEAVKAVARAIRRSRVGIREEGHPVGSFLFLGPTGVGKTELCRALAEAMFADENAIIRMDMSEYMERHTVSKLIGSPPGYVGYDEGGQLTEKVRRRPYSIVLFDEIEKAHPDVWNALLQIMDDGRLTDAQGRTVDFKNTIIVMTSNLGARDILGKKALGFAGAAEASADGTRPQAELKDKVMAELKRTFQPEFLNRLDEVIVFHQLDRQHIQSIAERMLEQLARRGEKLGVRLHVDSSAVAVLADRGFDPVYGARPLRRTIQSTLEDAIAEAILSGDYAEGDDVQVSGQEGELKIELQKQPAPQAEPVPV